MEQEILAGLIARGIPEHIAAGIVTRMRAESGLNPGINEVSPVVPGSRGGFGLNQWTGPRRVAFEKFADERGLPYDDLNAQLDFTKYELDTTEKSAWEALQGTKTPEEAARVYMTRFLRPGIPHADMRPGTPGFKPPSNFSGGVLPQIEAPAEMAWSDKAGLLGDALAAMQPQQQPAQLMPMQRSVYEPVKRDPLAIYRQFFGTLG